jgi:hypothetical protein
MIADRKGRTPRRRKQPPLTLANARSRGHYIDATHSAGLMVKEVYEAMLLSNDLAWLNREWDELLTDEEMVTLLGIAFPASNAARTPPDCTKARDRLFRETGHPHYRYRIVEGAACRTTARGRTLKIGGPKLRVAMTRKRAKSLISNLGEFLYHD